MQTTKTQPASTMTKRIGSTTYKVAVHFSKTSKEDMNDKIMRLIKNEPALGNAAMKKIEWIFPSDCDKMDSLQMSRLSERSSL